MPGRLLDLIRQRARHLIIEIGTRRIVHVAVTRSPTSAWTAQQLQNATAWGGCPMLLIRDGDKKFGTALDNVATGTGIRVILTPYRTPNAKQRKSGAAAAGGPHPKQA